MKLAASQALAAVGLELLVPVARVIGQEALVENCQMAGLAMGY